MSHPTSVEIVAVMIFPGIALCGSSSTKQGNVFYNGRPVCDDGWDNNDARVACKMLGYVIQTFRLGLIFLVQRYSSGSATMSSKYGSVPTNFILDDVACSGSETSLFSCSYTSSHNCGAGEGAGVICS